MARWAGTTTQRGLGAPHQAKRKALLPAALGTPCPGPWQGSRSPRCTGLMVDRKLMDLDEDPPRAVAKPVRWRMCCVPCNRGWGAGFGNRRRAQARAQPRRWSRAW